MASIITRSSTSLPSVVNEIGHIIASVWKLKGEGLIEVDLDELISTSNNDEEEGDSEHMEVAQRKLTLLS